MSVYSAPRLPTPSHGGNCPRLFVALWVDSCALPSRSTSSLPWWLSLAAFILVRHTGVCWVPQYFTWTSAHSLAIGNQYYFLQIKPALAPTFHLPIPLLIHSQADKEPKQYVEKYGVASILPWYSLLSRDWVPRAQTLGLLRTGFKSWRRFSLSGSLGARVCVY